MAAVGLPPTGVHVLRRTAAKLCRDASESIEAVSQFLDHFLAGRGDGLPVQAGGADGRELGQGGRRDRRLARARVNSG